MVSESLESSSERRIELLVPRVDTDTTECSRVYGIGNGNGRTECLFKMCRERALISCCELFRKRDLYRREALLCFGEITYPFNESLE